MTTKDLCHVVDCEEPAVDIAWCPSLGVCIQVCETHEFDTLSNDAPIDLDRAGADHEKNSVLYGQSMKQ
jgi:hypothetical protein